MIPGMNSRQAAQMMKKMGIAQQEIDAVEVIIRCEDRNIVIANPQVSKVNMMGQDMFQVQGAATEQAVSQTVDISEDDIATVVEQTGVDESKAREAIEKHNGDLAEAILELSS